MDHLGNALHHLIAADDMRWQPWPKGQVPQGVIEKSLRPNAFDEVKGSIVRSNFLAGEPFRPERLVKGTGSGFLSAVLPSGARAVAINIDEKSFNGLTCGRIRMRANCSPLAGSTRTVG